MQEQDTQPMHALPPGIAPLQRTWQTLGVIGDVIMGKQMIAEGRSYPKQPGRSSVSRRGRKALWCFSVPSLAMVPACMRMPETLTSLGHLRKDHEHV